MLNIISDFLSFIPPGFRTALSAAASAYVFLWLLGGIVRMYRSKDVQAFVRSVPDVVRKIGAFLEKQIDDPRKYPKMVRLVCYEYVVNCYLMACVLFAYFIVIVGLWATANKQFTLLESLGAVLFSLLCAYMSAVMKTQASRELTRLQGS